MSSARVLWSLLDSKARARFRWLLLLTTISGFVEVLSVGLVIPFIAVAASSLPFGTANTWTRSLMNFVGSLGVPEQSMTAALGVIFLLGVTLANVYLCLYQYYAAQVVGLQKRDFSVRVMKNITTQSLEWLDYHNSSELNKVALTDVTNVCSLINAAVQVAAILTRCIVVYCFFLLTQARLAVGLALSLAALYFIVYQFIQRPVVLAGANAQEAQSKMFRAASELIGGARSVRATSTEARFFDRFVVAADAAVKPSITRVMPGYLTRAGLETATVGLVIGMLIYFNAKDGSLINGLPLLSSYAVAGIRLLPALQQSLAYYLEIKFCEPCLEAVAGLLRDQPSQTMPSPEGPLSLAERLDLKEVTYGYSSVRSVLHSISLTIAKNMRVAFVGETGAGKSTLIDILLALRFPQQGGLYVDGVQITSQNARSWRLDVGYVPQSIYLLDATIAENIAFGMSPSEIEPEQLARACEAASLNRYIDSLPDGVQTLVGERGVRLSGGQCQRIGIARALYNDPDIVIFDEATASLDSQTENSILEALNTLKGAKTLVVIAHRLNTVWDFERIFVMDNGRIVGQGTSEELLKDCRAFERLARHQLNLGSS